MLSGDFQRKLKKLNRNLHIYCGNDDRRPAGLYWSKYQMGIESNPEDHVEICGVDKNYLPELPIVDENNHLVKGGWRRVLVMLIARKLVDKRKAESLFSTGFDKAVMTPINKETDPILRAIAEVEQRNLERNEGKARDFMRIGATAEEAMKAAKNTYKRDEMVDIARMIHQKKKRG
jgi:hypothetical protein